MCDLGLKQEFTHHMAAHAPPSGGYILRKKYISSQSLSAPMNLTPIPIEGQYEMVWSDDMFCLFIFKYNQIINIHINGKINITLGCVF